MKLSLIIIFTTIVFERLHFNILYLTLYFSWKNRIYLNLSTFVLSLSRLKVFNFLKDKAWQSTVLNLKDKVFNLFIKNWYGTVPVTVPYRYHTVPVFRLFEKWKNPYVHSFLGDIFPIYTYIIQKIKYDNLKFDRMLQTIPKGFHENFWTQTR